MVRLRSVTGTHDRCGCQLRGSRVKSNRVFYRPAPERLPGQKGASRKDGERFQCSDERTHGQPDETWEGTDDTGATGHALPFVPVGHTCSPTETTLDLHQDGPKAFIQGVELVIRSFAKRATSRKRAKREPLSEVSRRLFLIFARLSWI